YELKNTITVSPFSVESAFVSEREKNLHDLNVTNTSIRFNLCNLYRLSKDLFPLEPEVLKDVLTGIQRCSTFFKKQWDSKPTTTMRSLALPAPEIPAKENEESNEEKERPSENAEVEAAEDHIFEHVPQRLI
ncbi:patatin-like phospholipase domain-containing 2, partial [Pelobates cultripes]